MKHKLLYVALLTTVLFNANQTFSQNIGVNATGAAPAASAGFDVDFTNKGLLIPRVALTATNAAGPIAAPATSLLVYNTVTAGATPNTVFPGYYYWDGAKWVALGGSGGKDWGILGNAGTVAATNFVGTTDAQALDFRTNNTIRFRIANGNQVHAMSLGTTALPFYSFSADPNTGLWSSAADRLNFSTNALERLELGTTEAVFNDISADYDFRIESDGRANMFFVNGGNNRIGINTATPQGQFEYIHDGAAVGGFSSYWTNSTTDGALQLMNSSTTGNGSRVLLAATNYNASAFVASAVMGLSLNATTTGTGGVGLYGAANNESGNAVEGSLSFAGGYTGWAGYFNADVYCGGTYIGSDRKLKRDINPIIGALAMLDKIEPVSYFMNTEKYPEIGFDENRLSYGFIAQDLEKVIPEMVKDKNLVLNSNKTKDASFQEERKNELFKVVNYTLMIPIAVQAIKEQQTIIESQNAKIEALEKIVLELKKAIENK